MNKRSCIIDIESNDFTENLVDYSSFPYKLKEGARLWCVVVRDLETGEEQFAELGNITPEWLEGALRPYHYIIAHNGHKFDLPQLKLFGVLVYTIGYPGQSDTVFGRDCKFLDSLILSRLANPDRPAHSLKYWGRKVGELKDDYREQCIKAGYIEKSDPKGAEFKKYNPLMLPYCRQDCKANAKAFLEIKREFLNHNWGKSVEVEHKLADLAFRRENLGFDFDKELAIECLEDLNRKMDDIAAKVEPILPPKPLNKTETNFWTPPKKQVNKDGSLSKHMIAFLERIGAECEDDSFVHDGKKYKIPFHQPLKTHSRAEMKDLDHIKAYLIELGWVPIEWNERDITKDSSKKILPMEKRQKVLDRWYRETFDDQKYLEGRVRELDMPRSKIYEHLQKKLGDKWPVRVPTTPKIKVGVEKELCQNLVKLGEKVAFAKDFADWLTYRHRRNSIAGGDVSDMDFEEGDVPTSGFLSNYREEDGRISTPSIEIGAVTNRYTHINVANIPRPTSIYGKEMRSLFRAGKGNVFFGFDYASLEARIMAHYVYKYPDGVELGKMFVAEKPNDWHSNQSRAMGIPRTEVKSLDYGILYGAQWAKVKKMTGRSDSEAKEIVENFWNGSPALKALRDKLVEYWESTGKKYVLGIDGRKIMVRSKHSALNSLFQSAGVIYAKYITVLLNRKMEEQGLCTDPFEGDPDICSMIEYHDEQDMYAKPDLFKFKTFTTEDQAKEFVDKWEGGQLSAISKGKNGFYVALPSVVSMAIEESMAQITKFLKINVEMGFEYMIGNNWYECH